MVFTERLCRMRRLAPAARSPWNRDDTVGVAEDQVATARCARRRRRIGTSICASLAAALGIQWRDAAMKVTGKRRSRIARMSRTSPSGDAAPRAARALAAVDRSLAPWRDPSPRRRRRTPGPRRAPDRRSARFPARTDFRLSRRGRRRCTRRFWHSRRAPARRPAVGYARPSPRSVCPSASRHIGHHRDIEPAAHFGKKSVIARSNIIGSLPVEGNRCGCRTPSRRDAGRAVIRRTNLTAARAMEQHQRDGKIQQIPADAVDERRVIRAGQVEDLA